MARKPDDWMPLRIGLYLADTTHLTRDQHGAYLLLLMGYWMRGGALPADDRQLATISKCTLPEWRRMRPVMVTFFSERDGKWFQKRAEEELEKARKFVDAKSGAGKKGAEKRWQTDGKANGKRMAEPSNSHWQTDAPLPSPLPSEKEDTSLRSVSKKKLRTALPDIFPLQDDLDWADEHWISKGRADLCDQKPEQIRLFRDHHSANAKASADWPASWRTWAQNAVKFNRKQANGNADSGSSHDKFLAGGLAALDKFKAA